MSTAEQAGATAEQGAAPVAAVGRERLRELAMAATGMMPLVYSSPGGARLRCGAISQKVGAFHLAANPATVLALLDEIANLIDLLRRIRTTFDRALIREVDEVLGTAHPRGCGTPPEKMPGPTFATVHIPEGAGRRRCDGCSRPKERVCIECDMCPDCGCEGCPTE